MKIFYVFLITSIAISSGTVAMQQQQPVMHHQLEPSLSQSIQHIQQRISSRTFTALPICAAALFAVSFILSCVKTISSSRLARYPILNYLTRIAQYVALSPIGTYMEVACLVAGCIIFIYYVVQLHNLEKEFKQFEARIGLFQNLLNCGLSSVDSIKRQMLEIYTKIYSQQNDNQSTKEKIDLFKQYVDRCCDQIDALTAALQQQAAPPVIAVIAQPTGVSLANNDPFSPLAAAAASTK